MLQLKYTHQDWMLFLAGKTRYETFETHYVEINFFDVK